MGYFQTTPGHVDCPKCFGWQIRDLTPRNAAGWPKGPANIVDCDHCGGKGEVPGVAVAAPAVIGWGAQPVAPPLPAAPVQAPRRRGRPPKSEAMPPINDINDVPMPPEHFDCAKRCSNMLPNPWAAIKPVDSPAPQAQGWAAFNKEPG